MRPINWVRMKLASLGENAWIRELEAENRGLEEILSNLEEYLEKQVAVNAGLQDALCLATQRNQNNHASFLETMGSVIASLGGEVTVPDAIIELVKSSQVVLDYDTTVAGATTVKLTLNKTEDELILESETAQEELAG